MATKIEQEHLETYFVCKTMEMDQFSLKLIFGQGILPKFLFITYYSCAYINVLLERKFLGNRNHPCETFVTDNQFPQFQVRFILRVFHFLRSKQVMLVSALEKSPVCVASNPI